MSPETSSALHRAVLHLPILTTIVSIVFATLLFRRYRQRGGGPHLLWWGLGMVTYGLGTFTESWTTVLGWNPVIFKIWYVAGAFLGGYPLAQGSIYLLARKRFANGSAIVVSTLIGVAAILVAFSPLDPTAAEVHRLSGRVLEWQWLRAFSPFINLYSVAFLAGGAFVSALRFRREPELRSRYVGNILIALGAILPGIGGTFTRFGVVEMLYVTELAGLLLIFFGYRKCIQAPSPAPRAHVAAAVTALLLAGLLAAPASAQTSGPAVDADQPAEAGAAAEAADRDASRDDAAATDPSASFFDETTVTATGSERNVFEIATPVTVIRAEQIERLAADNPAELLREQPGVDVNGIGPNQARPVIRGQRGLRVLFLEDGLRLNNARRQTDFGEISGLVDLDGVAAVEVVRGPASVLYGSDAIGGVLNLVPKRPTFGNGDWNGFADVRYGDAADAVSGSAGVSGRFGRLEAQVGFSIRESSDYQAPEGSFGRIRLDQDTDVVDTGLDDQSLWGNFVLGLTDGQYLRLRGQRYRAEETGFGFVEPGEYGAEEDFRIRILYPYQDFDRWTLGYEGSALDLAIADTVDAKVYWQQNQRELANDIDIDIGPLAPGWPHSSVESDTLNYTDLETYGLRFEAIKALGEKNLLTWGVEGYQDDSFNTDSSVTNTILRFPFPPFEMVIPGGDDVANAPNATNTSLGVFAQDEWTVGERFRVTAGLRWQQVDTKAEATPGWDTAGLDFSDDQVVGAVTGTYQITDALNALASFGTAFRAPSIIERLFNGLTPEGSGFQILNPDLSSESSENWDLGLKYRRRNAFMEVVVFRNDISDGIIQYFLSPDEIAQLPDDVRQEIEDARVSFVVQQRNAEKLRYEGVELALGYRTAFGLSVGGNFSYIDGERLDSTNPPTGDNYGEKYVGWLRYEPSGGRFWSEYRVRHNASTDANVDPNEPAPPVGSVLPSFTIHTLGAGARLFELGRTSHELQLVIENLTDELYAEFSNATFFRPEPGRNVKATYRIRF
ncbi:MAG TPA: TonB-dependent receptor [Thermoanaerobaculia bacterium]|nr:TonB-dependent receptor [Thermoanaerobaculia bacterium]